MTRDSRWVWAPLVLAALWLLMMATGTGWLDRMVLHFLYSADHPWLRAAAVTVTMFGEWQLVVAVTVAVTIGTLIIRRAPKQALLFAAVVLVGRLLVQLQKTGIGRLRPEDREHLVPVKSLSFPSGHSANSMILCLAMAMLIVPLPHRRVAIPIAVAMSLIVGISRPMLGVHWPSDVIGGWSFGAAWVLTMAGLAERWPFERKSDGPELPKQP